MISSFSAYPLYQRLDTTTRAAEQAKFAKSSVVKSEIAYFKARVASIKTPEDFVKNYRLLKFALEAYNMSDQLQYPGRIKTVLLDDVSDSTALVNKMTSANYRTINKAFDFFNSGVSKLSDEAFINDLTARYEKFKYRENLGQMNPALSDALYFEEKIKTVKTGYEIIGDPILFDVVKTALNIPAAVGGSAKIERLKAWVEKGFDLTKVNDAAYVKKMVSRFLVLKDVENRQSIANPLLDMFV